MTDKIKNESGLAPGKEPDRYIYLNPVRAETNEKLMPPQVHYKHLLSMM